MQKRTLGSLEVSPVGLGCMGMSSSYGLPPRRPLRNPHRLRQYPQHHLIRPAADRPLARYSQVCDRATAFGQYGSYQPQS